MSDELTQDDWDLILQAHANSYAEPIIKSDRISAETPVLLGEPPDIDFSKSVTRSIGTLRRIRLFGKYEIWIMRRNY